MRYGAGPWDRSQRNRAHRSAPPHVNRVAYEGGKPVFTAWDAGTPKVGLYDTEAAANVALGLNDHILGTLWASKVAAAFGDTRRCVITLADLGEAA